MAKMTESQVQAYAKGRVFDSLFGAVEGAVQYDYGKFAIPVDCEGEVRFVKVALVTAKSTFDLTAEAEDFGLRKAAAEKKSADQAAARAERAREKAEKAKTKEEKGE